MQLTQRCDNLPKELDELKALNNWICYKLEPRPTKEDPNHLGKVPYDPKTGKRAKANDPRTWSDFETAQREAMTGKYSGIGFELGDSGYCGIDIDHCISDVGATDAAQEIIDQANSYTEISISGTGVHIIAKSTPLDKNGYNKPEQEGLDLEIYRPTEKKNGGFLGEVEGGRFLTISGKVFGEARPISDRSTQVGELVSRYWPKKEQPAPAKTTVIVNDADTESKIIRSALNAINPGELDFDNWAAVVSALKSCGFSPDDAEAWSYANGTNLKHVTGYIHKRWEKFHLPDRNDNGAAGVIVNRAKEKGWTAADAFTDEERKAYGRELYEKRLMEIEKKTREWIKARKEGKATESKSEDKASTENTEPLSWVKASAIERKEVSWLIDQYIPRKGITIIGGDGGVGKSSIECSLAAAISTGRSTFLEGDIPFTARPREPGKVVILNGEDPYSEVLKPLLTANGANEENIILLDERQIKEMGLTYDDERLKNDVVSFQPDLIIFDPLQAFLPDRVNMAERNKMRRQVNHALALAERCNCAVLIVMHTNKSKQCYGRKRLADSADVWDIARSVLMAGHIDGTETMYMSHEKSNFGRLQDSLVYDFDDNRVIRVLERNQKRDRDYIFEADVLNQEKQTGAAGAADEAEEMITDLLSEAGEMSSKELEAELKEAGISANAIKSAKKHMREAGFLKARKESTGRNGGVRWFYSLVQPDVHDLSLPPSN